jgi:hypothetical protein
MKYIDEENTIKDPKIGGEWSFSHTVHIDLYNCDVNVYKSSCGEYTIQVLHQKAKANMFNSMGDEIAKYGHGKLRWVALSDQFVKLQSRAYWTGDNIDEDD